jgi:hypothetical protein
MVDVNAIEERAVLVHPEGLATRAVRLRYQDTQEVWWTNR